MCKKQLRENYKLDDLDGTLKIGNYDMSVQDQEIWEIVPVYDRVSFKQTIGHLLRFILLKD